MKSILSVAVLCLPLLLAPASGQAGPPAPAPAAAEPPAAGLAPPPGPASTAEITFHAAFADAAAAARAAGGPVIAFCVASWSPHSRRLLDGLTGSPAARARLAGAALLRFDDEAGRAFRDRHRVRELPTALLLTPDGDEIGRIPGALAPAAWVERLDAILAAAPKR